MLKDHERTIGWSILMGVLFLIAMMLVIVVVGSAQERHQDHRCGCCGPCYNEHKLIRNPMSQEWEHKRERKQLKLNVFDGTWSYECPDSELQLNPFNGEWEYVN